MVDRAVGMPMLIYNNPRYSGYNIQPNFMARLVEAVPNIFGAKLAMGSVDEAMAYMKAVKAPFAPYALASNLVAAMSVGVAGTISPPLAVTPEIGVELVRAIDAGDAARALALQKDVIRIHDIFLRLAGPFGRTIYREAMRLRGFDVKMYPRWPSKPLSREAYDEMRDLFTELKIIGAAGQAEECVGGMKINRLLGIITILSFGLLAVSAARAEERVRVALSVRNVVFLPFYYAKALRIYDKHGLERRADSDAQRFAVGRAWCLARSITRRRWDRRARRSPTRCR